MAKDTKNTAADAAFDISKYLPEGWSEKDFKTIGGFRMMVTPQVSYENRAPVFGVIMGIQVMPPRESLNKKGEKEDWACVLVELRAPTIATKSGTRDNTEVPIGTDILIPMNGSLNNNHDLIKAAQDPAHVYIGLFTVTGQVDTGMPTPMWEYEVKVAMSKPLKRDGRYALLHRQQPKGLLTTGESFNAQTGEVSA